MKYRVLGNGQVLIQTESDDEMQEVLAFVNAEEDQTITPYLGTGDGDPTGGKGH